MFYQSFFSPQVKRCAIISYKHGAYKLTHAFRSDNPIILKSPRVILPPKKKNIQFSPRLSPRPQQKRAPKPSIRPSTKCPARAPYAKNRTNGSPTPNSHHEPPTPKTGQMAPPPSARSCTPPRKYPYTTNRNNIPQPTYASNTKQTNDGIFSNRAGENFKLAKTFLNVRVRL